MRPLTLVGALTWQCLQGIAPRLICTCLYVPLCTLSILVLICFETIFPCLPDDHFFSGQKLMSTWWKERRWRCARRSPCGSLWRAVVELHLQLEVSRNWNYKGPRVQMINTNIICVHIFCLDMLSLSYHTFLTYSLHSCIINTYICLCQVFIQSIHFHPKTILTSFDLVCVHCVHCVSQGVLDGGLVGAT